MHSLYTILGIQENASDLQVQDAYERLMERLKLEGFPDKSIGYAQCQKCLLSIESAYKTLKDPALKERYLEDWKAELKAAAEGELHPKVGQLCVASGMISLEQLEEAMAGQQSLQLPLGEILQENNLITQAELDGLLIGQKLISLPADSPHSLGQRLIALGLVTEDMIRIALIEQRTFGKRLGELLVSHGWVDAEILSILLAVEPSVEIEKMNAKSKSTTASKESS